ncbi:50S ribosomal protein L29 [bacterium]|nr:50S ribosomal protein L29 [bacterium]
MDVKQIRGLSLVELEEKLRAVREQLFKLKFQKAMISPKNPLIIRGLRRDVARMKTILSERETEQKTKKE